MIQRHITPHPKKPGVYLVQLVRDGREGGLYEVDPNRQWCGCRGFEFHQRCSHLDELNDELEQQMACDLCHGYGALFPRCTYVNSAPIECARCAGSGVREPAMSDADLRRLFA